MSQMDLAKAASVGIATVQRIESGGDQVRGAAETLWKIEKALQDAGIIFIAPDETGGSGVRLRAWPDDRSVE